MKSRLLSVLFCAALIVSGTVASAGEFPWQLGWLFG